MRLIVYSMLLFLVHCPLQLLAKPCTLKANEVQDWLGWNIAQLTELTIGPEGGRIFPLWNRESGAPVFEGVLVLVPVMVDIGVEVTAELRMYFEATSLKPRTLVFELVQPLELGQAAAYFKVPFQLRSCRAAEDPDAVETMLEPASEGEGTLNLAVFPELRLVAELFGSEDSISALRWVAPPQSLDGCP